MKQILLSALFGLFTLLSPLASQTVAESPSGLFIAYAEKPHAIKPPAIGNFASEIKIFSSVQQAHIQSVWLEMAPGMGFDTVYFSQKGGFLVAIPKNRQGSVFNVRTGKFMGLLGFRQAVVFTADDKFGYVMHSNWIQLWDMQTRKLSNKFKCSEQESITQLELSGDEHYLIGQSTTHTWVWDLDGPGTLRKYPATAHAVDNSRGLLTLLNVVNNDVVSTLVVLKTGKVIQKNKLSAILKNINLRVDSLLQSKQVPEFKGSKARLTINGSSARLSKNGSFLALSCTLNESKTGLLLVLNTVTKAFQLWPREEQAGAGFNWADDQSLLFRKNAEQVFLLNARSTGGPTPLFSLFDFTKSRNERIIPNEKQAALEHFSSNGMYVGLSDKFKGAERIYLRPTLIKQDKSLADSAHFLGFSPGSDLVYFLSPDNHLGYIRTEEVEADLGSGNLRKHFFTDTLVIPIQGEILHDPLPPPGYFFPRITAFKHISEANAATPLHVYLKTMAPGASETSLMVHLIDTNGVYYYGAADSAWRKIWCNLLLFHPNETVSQITDFSVTEYKEDSAYHNAMCVAMDFSGSMGRGRGHLLQTGVLKFIGSKLEHEGIGVVKYDNRVVEECDVTTDKAQLKENMNRTGYESLSRSTALLDALDHSIDLLKSTKGYENKFILILTDGCENASVVSKKYILEKALQNNIRIFTIGLGDYVSEGYLKSLSYNTQGSYYRIYNSENLDWIYQDIRNKIKNYYTIRFKTGPDSESKTSTYKALLNICLDKKYTDTLTVVFDNALPSNKLNTLKLKDELIVAPFSQAPNPKTGHFWDQYSPITDYSRIRSGLAMPGAPELNNAVQIKKSSAADSVREVFNALDFPAIKFDFDKTTIVKGTDEGIGNVVTFMLQHPRLLLEVEGHTDDKGTDEVNVPLSQARAEAVKAVLVSKGIPAKRITAKGYGSSKPLVKNDSEENRQINRRIDFTIM
jgi:outer membrane protein OmpA-like peptidoglycan-associated protein